MNPEPKRGLARLIEIAGTKRAFLWAAGLVNVLAVLAQATPYVTVYLLVDLLVRSLSVGAGLDLGFAWALAWWTLGAMAAYGLLTYIGALLNHVAAFQILYEIRVSLAAKLARLPLGYFTERASGGIKKVVTDDVERIELFVAHHISDIVQAAALPVVSLVFLAFVDLGLTLALIVPLAAALLAQGFMFRSGAQGLFAQWQEKLRVMNATIVEYVRGMPVLKVFNHSAAAFERFTAGVEGYRDLTLHWVRVTAASYAAFFTLLAATAVVVVPVAIVILASVDPGAPTYALLVSKVFLVLFVGLGMALPLYKLMGLSSHFHQIESGLVQIDAILAEAELPEPERGEVPRDSSVEFQNVGFGYGDQVVFESLSLRLEPGRVTALVGPSGGGKSTIAHLIGRFWDPSQGRILLGGVDLRDLGAAERSRQIATVFQDPFLFFDTLEANIRMGNQQATFDDVVNAAKAAQIHDVIEALPQGYQTRIGEGGTHLSGGERQRVALARALLKNAPIVLLDEATASADPENEVLIQKALSVVLEGRTVLVIAHRLHTIVDADQILVLDRGRLVESGQHEALVAAGGLYHRMWTAQSQARDWVLEAGGAS